MSTREQHGNELLGAYVLGVLDDEQAREVELHVESCAECRTELDDLRAMHDTLGEVPPEAFLDGPPEGGDLLLQRTLRRMRTERSSGLVGRRALTAAAVVVAVAVALGGGVLLGRGNGSTPQQGALPAPVPSSSEPTIVPGTKVVSGVQGGSRITATITPAAGWVTVNASVTGIPAGQRCRIVVVAKNGDREIAGSWLVSPKGAANGTNLDGAALVAPDQVASIQVENFDGHTFVAASA
jgi:Putative zinc-finger